MANNKKLNSKQKDDKKIEEALASLYDLDSYPLDFVDDHDDFHISPSFGQKKPLIIRMFTTAHWAVVNFVWDVFAATRAIIRRIV